MLFLFRTNIRTSMVINHIPVFVLGIWLTSLCIFGHSSYTSASAVLAPQISLTGDPSNVQLVAVPQNILPAIWWFNGENAVNYEEATRIFFAPDPGYIPSANAIYTFEVFRGQDKVFWEANGRSSYTAPRGTNNAVLKSNSPSLSKGDIGLRIRISDGPISVISRDASITVKAPDFLTKFATMHSSNTNRGYRSQIGFTIQDNFNKVLPRDVEINETLGTLINDYVLIGVEANWTFASPNGAIVPPNQVGDTMTPPGNLLGTRFPTPLNPAQSSGNYDGTKVKHRNINIWVGSTTPGRGINVYLANQQYYFDHGQHE